MRGTIPARERVYTTPLLDKLGIRPGMRVALIDVADQDIRSQILERTTDEARKEALAVLRPRPILAGV